MKRAVFFLLAACGSPFTGAVDPMPDAQAPERAELPEAGPDTHHRHHHDAGQDREILEETGPIPDAGHDAPPPPPVDSGSDVGDAGCSPPSSYQYKIYSGGVTTVGYPSPAACRCAATYDCACLLASPGVCTATYGFPTGCTAGTELTVDCTP